MSVGAFIGIVLTILGAPILVAGAWMDILNVLQALFGATLDGKPDTTLNLEFSFPFWGGITAVGMGLLYIGTKLRLSASQSDRDNSERTVSRFH